MTIGLAGAAVLAPCAAAAKPVFKTLYQFCSEAHCKDGTTPLAGLILDGHGNLFGTTRYGGKNGNGTVFELSPDGMEKVIHSFCSDCGDGTEPFSDLIRDVNGVLYGTASSRGPNGGGGIVFKLVPNADRAKWKYQILYSFCASQNCADGGTPVAGLAYRGVQTGAPYDGTSPLYGVSMRGGAWDRGTVFKLEWHRRKVVETVLHSFCSPQDCSDGTGPLTPLVLDAAGNIYGVTPAGDFDGGNLFEISADQGTLTTLYRFCEGGHCPNGSIPVSLAIDASENLMVAAADGGANDGGAIMKASPRGKKTRIAVLYNFCSDHDCADGGAPRGITVAPDGNIYGTAYDGGAAGMGTVFKLHRKTEKVLYSFCEEVACADGRLPRAGVVLDESLRIYGMTAGGGNNDEGTAFEITR